MRVSSISMIMVRSLFNEEIFCLLGGGRYMCNLRPQWVTYGILHRFCGFLICNISSTTVTTSDLEVRPSTSLRLFKLTIFLAQLELIWASVPWFFKSDHFIKPSYCRPKWSTVQYLFFVVTPIPESFNYQRPVISAICAQCMFKF